MRISKFNPIARAVAVMGATAALVTGITFAALQSNTVALGPNDIKTGSASLALASGTCPGEGVLGTTTAAGFTVTGLTSSSTVPPVSFCMQNTGDVPLNIFGYLDTNVSAAVASGYINLGVTCSIIGTNTAVLNTWYSVGQTFTSGSLPVGQQVDCTATLSLSNTYPGSGGETVPTFNLLFVGNEV